MQNPKNPSDAASAARRGHHLKVLITLGLVVSMLALVAAVFWYQDGRYSLPTPKPVALATVEMGQAVVLPAGFRPDAKDGRPVFLHFFNPNCPCSRFNAEHVRALRQRFGAQARFVAVVQVSEDQDDAQRRQSLAAAARLLGPEMEAVIDSKGKIAAACGVYSTPQAVILASDSTASTLLFRGNYNASRYCADPKTEFARQALESVVNHQPLPPESRSAMIAYGCELPANALAPKISQTKLSL